VIFRAQRSWGTGDWAKQATSLSDDINPRRLPAGGFAWRAWNDYRSLRRSHSFVDRVREENAVVRTSLKYASEWSLDRCEFIAVV